MLKPLTVWIATNWKILKEMGIPVHLTCLLRNLYAGQKATVRTGNAGVNIQLPVLWLSHEKNTYFCFIDHANEVDHKKLWKILY